MYNVSYKKGHLVVDIGITPNILTTPPKKNFYFIVVKREEKWEKNTE